MAQINIRIDGNLKGKVEKLFDELKEMEQGRYIL